MELPEDVVNEIRKYAKPRLKYQVEYLAAKATLTHKVLRILHRRLCDADRETVLSALKWYLTAFARRKEADE